MKIKNLLLACFIITGLTACEKGDSIDTEMATLTGKWFQEGKCCNDWFVQDLYHFKNDQTFEITKGVIDRNTKVIMGYLSRTTGAFEVVGDSLVLKDSKYYFVTTNDSYKKLEELTYSHTTKLRSYKLVYNTNLDSLTLIYPCPPNAYCRANPKLIRVLK